MAVNSIPDDESRVGKAPSGVVLPPKDIQSIVEKTAGYVARNGPAFEDRIRQKELQNPKFSFLNLNDAYNPFYTWRLSEIREGRGTAISAGRTGEAAAAATAAQEPEQPKGPPEPPEFRFSARMPNISAQDLEVVRLTALFMAKHGRAFVTTLSQKETGNYQFDFLRPQHSLYQFFTRLVDQYTELLTGVETEKSRLAQLEHNVQDRFHILGRAKQRAEWVKYQEEQKQKQEEEAEAEKLAYAQIDWHDFVVVETVLFNEVDEQSDLPPPTSLSDLQSASLEQKAMMSLQPHNMRIEEAMPTADDEQLFQAPPPPIPAQEHTPYVPLVVGTGSIDNQRYDMRETEEQQRIREREEARLRAEQTQLAAKGQTGQMRIRNDYVPRAQAKRKNEALALCPNCGDKIPYDELDEHMRIELLDPRWKQEKQKAESRYATTNLSTADVANNLKRLASRRTDVFDGVAPPEALSEEEEARRKRAAIASYDGASDAKDTIKAQHMQTMNVQEQIKHIHEKFG